MAGLSTVGSGNVLVTKTADTSTQQIWRLTFVAGRGAQDVQQTTIDTDDIAVSGGTATPSAVTNTAGHHSDNEVQQVQLNGAQSGTFTLTLAGQTTAAIAYNATAATVKSALEALSNLDNVTVTGSAGGPYEVTFGGSSSGTNLAQLTSNATSLTYVSHVFQYTYDPAGNLLTASDNDSAYAYAYDGLGRVTSVDNNGTPNIPRVILQNQFDTMGRRTQLTASIGGTADFLNAYPFYPYLAELRCARWPTRMVSIVPRSKSQQTLEAGRFRVPFLRERESCIRHSICLPPGSSSRSVRVRMSQDPNSVAAGDFVRVHVAPSL